MRSRPANGSPMPRSACTSPNTRRTEFTGALQGYRVRRGNDPRSMAEMRTFSGRTIDVPACYIAGKSGLGHLPDARRVRSDADQGLHTMARRPPDRRGRALGQNVSENRSLRHRRQRQLHRGEPDRRRARRDADRPVARARRDHAPRRPPDHDAGDRAARAGARASSLRRQHLPRAVRRRAAGREGLRHALGLRDDQAASRSGRHADRHAERHGGRRHPRSHRAAADASAA